jgi:hypothetical protein
MSWNDREAIDAERFDADMEMAQLEAAGRSASKRAKCMRALRAAGRLDEAAAACTHGSGAPLRSICSSEGTSGWGIDPNAGEDGWRCHDCGSRLSDEPWVGGRVVTPCEVIR